MPRYIDAKKLSESLRKNCDGCKEMWTDYCSTCWCSIAQLLEMIGNAPTADVVEVVRCRDCEYWDPGSPMATVIPTPCRCRLRRETDATTAEDFCSYGRRKEKTDER